MQPTLPSSSPSLSPARKRLAAPSPATATPASSRAEAPPPSPLSLWLPDDVVALIVRDLPLSDLRAFAATSRTYRLSVARVGTPALLRSLCRNLVTSVGSLQSTTAGLLDAAPVSLENAVVAAVAPVVAPVAPAPWWMISFANSTASLCASLAYACRTLPVEPPEVDSVLIAINSALLALVSLASRSVEGWGTLAAAVETADRAHSDVRASFTPGDFNVAKVRTHLASLPSDLRLVFWRATIRGGLEASVNDFAQLTDNQASTRRHWANYVASSLDIQAIDAALGDIEAALPLRWRMRVGDTLIRVDESGVVSVVDVDGAVLSEGEVDGRLPRRSSLAFQFLSLLIFARSISSLGTKGEELADRCWRLLDRMMIVHCFMPTDLPPVPENVVERWLALWGPFLRISFANGDRKPVEHLVYAVTGPASFSRALSDLSSAIETHKPYEASSDQDSGFYDCMLWVLEVFATRFPAVAAKETVMLVVSAAQGMASRPLAHLSKFHLRLTEIIFCLDGRLAALVKEDDSLFDHLTRESSGMLRLDFEQLCTSYFKISGARGWLRIIPAFCRPESLEAFWNDIWIEKRPKVYDLCQRLSLDSFRQTVGLVLSQAPKWGARKAFTALSPLSENTTAVAACGLAGQLLDFSLAGFSTSPSPMIAHIITSLVPLLDKSQLRRVLHDVTKYLEPDDSQRQRRNYITTLCAAFAAYPWSDLDDSDNAAKAALQLLFNVLNSPQRWSFASVADRGPLYMRMLAAKHDVEYEGLRDFWIGHALASGRRVTRGVLLATGEYAARLEAAGRAPPHAFDRLLVDALKAASLTATSVGLAKALASIFLGDEAATADGAVSGEAPASWWRAQPSRAVVLELARVLFSVAGGGKALGTEGYPELDIAGLVLQARGDARLTPAAEAAVSRLWGAAAAHGYPDVPLPKPWWQASAPVSVASAAAVASAKTDERVRRELSICLAELWRTESALVHAQLTPAGPLSDADGGEGGNGALPAVQPPPPLPPPPPVLRNRVNELRLAFDVAVQGADAAEDAAQVEEETVESVVRRIWPADPPPIPPAHAILMRIVAQGANLTV